MSIYKIAPLNPILDVDSYKLHHHAEYPKSTNAIYSTVVPRKASKEINEIVAFGSTLVAETLASITITKRMIDEAEEEVNAYGYDFNREGWEIIVDEFDGKLPLVVMAVEEGTVVKPNTPILGIMNTDPRFFWLTSYVETMVQRIMWKMTTVASVSRYCYKTIEKMMEFDGSDMAGLEYKLHNFGDRGADSGEAAVMTGIAHAALFSGSDCTSANRAIRRLYDTDKNYLSSVDATEHSVTTAFSNAKFNDDFGAALMSVERLEEAVARSKRGVGIPLQSMVIDTYDDVRFVSEYLGTILKDRIIASGGVAVCRPDSGNIFAKPVEIIKLLDEKFGSTKNDKGYKVLHPSVRVIQGDGLTHKDIFDIMCNLNAAGYSMDNLVLGMGGGLTHGPGRDEFSFSMKATARFDNVVGDWVDLLKEPKTDMGKKSHKGLVMCHYEDGELKVKVAEDAMELTAGEDGWKIIYANGGVINKPSFDEVRERARK